MAERDDRQPASACHCLAVRKASRWVTQLYDEHLAEAGLRAGQFGVLSHLERLGPVSVAALAQALVMDRTTLTRNMAPLERDGLLRIETAQDDRRRKDVHLTPEGRELLARARPKWRRAQAAFEKHFGAGQAEFLRALLQQVPVGEPAEEDIQPEA